MYSITAQVFELCPSQYHRGLRHISRDTGRTTTAREMWSGPIREGSLGGDMRDSVGEGKVAETRWEWILMRERSEDSDEGLVELSHGAGLRER